MQGDDPKYLRVVAMPKHFAVHSGPESAAISLQKGTDNDCSLPTSDVPAYRDAVQQELFSERDVDIPLKRLFRVRFQLGMFDPSELVKFAQIPFSENDSEAHRQLALKATQPSSAGSGCSGLPQG
jgi:beta-glucosidase